MNNKNKAINIRNFFTCQIDPETPNVAVSQMTTGGWLLGGSNSHTNGKTQTSPKPDLALISS